MRKKLPRSPIEDAASYALTRAYIAIDTGEDSGVLRATLDAALVAATAAATTTPEWRSLKDLAAHWAISERTVTGLTTVALPYHMMGGLRRYHRDAIRAYELATLRK